MRTHASVLVLGLVLLAPRPLAQYSEIRGARLTAQPRTVPIERITIENRRNSPLVSWEVGFVRSGANRPWMTHSSDFSVSGRYPDGDGPIQPNERRLIEVQVDSPEANVVGLTMVAFADGYAQGDTAALAPWRQRRQERANDLGYWIRSVATMPRGSEQEARQYLAERAAERAGQINGDPSGLRDRLSFLARQQNTPLANLLFAVDRARTEAARDLTILQRSLTVTSADNSGSAVTSAGVSSERAAGTEVVVTIENLRNVPLEALAFDIIDHDGRAGRTTGIDYCCEAADRSKPGSSLQPGEVREFPLRHRLKDGEAPPPVRLKYVMFEDLLFEGSAADRTALLRAREERADDLAYAIAALTQAASVPGAAEAVLTTKRAERARQLQMLGRHSMLGNLDEWIRQAKVSPGEFAANVPAIQSSFELQRQRLLRHISR
jgi:hypothetical protein